MGTYTGTAVDADGNGAGVHVLFAQINAGTSLTEADFWIGG